jgi:transposase
VFGLTKRRRSYTKEFKVEAVRLVAGRDRTIADVARSLGITDKLLFKWRQQYGGQAAEAFPGHGNRTARDQEFWLLKRELSQVTEERDILKKALAYFAKEPK